MALAIDASTPAVATQATGTTATVVSPSFTPPDGALLLVRWSANSAAGVNPSAPTITDSRGVPLTYQLIDWHSRADAPTADGQCAAWIAVVTAPVAMTITVTNGASSGNRHAALHITVLTGQTDSPLGANGSAGSGSAASIAQAYTAEGNSSRGFIVTSDWSTTGAQTAGTGCTLTNGGSANVGTAFTYGFLRRLFADGVDGVSNSLNVTLPGTSTDLSWVYVEILAAEELGGPLPKYRELPPWPILQQIVATRFAQYSMNEEEVATTEVTAEPVDLLLEAVALDPVPGMVSVDLVPADLALSPVAFTPTPGMVSVALAPATLDLTAVALSPVPTPVEIALQPATMALSAVALDPVPGAVATALTPASVALTAVAVVPVPGSVTVGLAPAGVSLEARPLTPVPGSVTVTLSAAVLNLGAVALGAQGVGTVVLGAAGLTLEALPLTPVPGPVSIALTSAILDLSARPLAPTPGPVQVELVAAHLQLSPEPLAAIPGPIAMTLAPALLVLEAGALAPSEGLPPSGRPPDIVIDLPGVRVVAEASGHIVVDLTGVPGAAVEALPRVITVNIEPGTS